MGATFPDELNRNEIRLYYFHGRITGYVSVTHIESSSSNVCIAQIRKPRKAATGVSMERDVLFKTFALDGITLENESRTSERFGAYSSIVCKSSGNRTSPS